MKPKANSLAVVQFILSVLAAFMFFSLSSGLVLLGITSLMPGMSEDLSANSAAPFLWAAGLSFCGALMLPSALFALLRWTGRPFTGLKPEHHVLFNRIALFLLVVGFPAALGLGWRAGKSLWGSVLLLPPMHVLAVGIPVLWVVLIGLRGLPGGSPQRLWGVFAAGLTLSPIIAITLEIIALFFLILVGSVFIALDPELNQQVQTLVELLRQSPDPEQALELLQPLISHPLVAIGAVLMLAVLVPLIEEIFKPIGVYLLLHRRITPTEGFVIGLLNGAGFALFESLAASTDGESWAGTMLLRATTAALHSFNSALIGFGLASAFSEKRYLRLLVCFVSAVSLHGLWNGITLVAINTGLQVPLQQATVSDLTSIAWIPVVLVCLSGLSLLGIILLNRHLNHAIIPPARKELR